jgi:penicillin-binding protein 1A
MQLSRSLFIPSNQNKYRRKIIELLLSLWLNKQFSKDEILKIYIASVRFEKGVMGLAQAIKYFFEGDITDRQLTEEESLFLVERLSNVSSTVNWTRIDHLLTRTRQTIDKNNFHNIYNRLLSQGKLRSINR